MTEREGIPGISRRQFLAYSGAGGTLLVLRDGLFAEALAQLGIGDQPGPATLTRDARRREDFLSLTFDFLNLKLDNSKPKRLVKTVANQSAYLVVGFPPQHLSDEALEENQLLPPGDVRSRVAGPSRLAFLVPATALPLPFTFDALLNWALMQQSVVAAAGPEAGPANAVNPASHQTAIELPWFLVLSPRPDAGWAHKRQPVTLGNRTELWHTRLGTRVEAQPPKVDETDDAKRTVRAVWARDPGFNPTVAPPSAAPPPRFSLTANDRWQIVGLSTRVSDRKPVQVNRLMLSALGGWLDSRGAWNPTGDFDIEEWRHRATMGRDSYVRVVRRGFLMPFGHKAAKITISERQFKTLDGHPQGAYLIIRQYIVVRQALKEFGMAKAKHQPSDGRGFPFRSVRITTLVTPNLAINDSQVYFPVAADGGADVQFDLIGLDWEGQSSEFKAPLMWVAQSAVYDDPDDPGPAMSLGDLAKAYNQAPNSEQRRKRPANGQKVAFAPATKGGDTTFSVEHLKLKVQELVGTSPADLQNKLGELANLREPPFYPLLEEATVQLSAAAQTAGNLLDTAKVALDQAFVNFGLPDMPLPDITDPAKLAEAAKNHAGELFLSLIGDLPDLGFGSSDKAGGIATPNLSIAALSRALGPVGGVLDNLRQGTFDPKSFFDPAAKLLGSLKLGDVIKFIEGPNGLGEKGPKLQNIIEPKPPDGIPETVTTKLDWEPDLEVIEKGDPLKIFDATPGQSSLTLKAEVVTNLKHPDESTFSVEGLLRNVHLHLIGKGSAFLILEVKQVKFTAGKDKPPDVDPQLGEITFAGPLAFVEEMRNFLSSLGKGYGITVQPSGIEASLSLPLPSIGVGVFTMQNISIGLGATIPFNGDPAKFRFAFCTRENPFILTVAMFGGGGFFGIECGTDKSIMLELSLEFGAAVAFDIGVASGGAEIMAGIYIKVENDDALLSGFLRAAGELDILGLIRISCEIYLGFEYHTKSDKCVGEARFYLEIEIFGFITIPVEAKVRRAFGGEGDPTFAQLMSPDNWTEYCNAYAPLVNA